MSDYIKRETLMARIRGTGYANQVKDVMLAMAAIIPTAPVWEVVSGKWKKRMEEKETAYYRSFTPIWTCSECGTDYDPSVCMTINFCPNCGADMREEAEKNG